MPTPTEQRALAFLAGVLLLGAGTRAVGAAGNAPATPDARSRAELHRQIEAVDSARRRRATGQGKRRRAAKDSAGGPASTSAGSVWRPDLPRPTVYYLMPGHTRLQRLGADSLRSATGGAGTAGESFRPGFTPPAPVDLDVASEAEIEQLPRIGPALARRIAADRAAHGPFGSLEALTRVRGIGPGIARVIAPYVTFTLTPRPSTEGAAASGATGGRGRRLRKPRTP
jgi:hypothetical protein